MTRKESTLASAIALTQKREQYDASCKRLLSEKSILAWIMKYTMPEYEKFTTTEIAEHYIEGHIDVAAIHVHPDKTNTSRIIGSSSEDATVSEGTVTFDIKFHAVVPSSKERIRLIINIEAQSDFYPGYPLVTRGIYYCSRLISSQLDTTFHNSHYEDIQKVYSIWVCTNPPKYRQNTMSAYSITEDTSYEFFREEKAHYDLMNTTMLFLGDEDLAEHKTLIRMLDILFSKKLTAKEKIELLAYEYKLPITTNTEREVSHMGSLGQAIFDDGFNNGLLDSIQRLITHQHVTATSALDMLGIPTMDQHLYLQLLEEKQNKQQH